MKAKSLFSLQSVKQKICDKSNIFPSVAESFANVSQWRSNSMQSTEFKSPFHQDIPVQFNEVSFSLLMVYLRPGLEIHAKFNHKDQGMIPY